MSREEAVQCVVSHVAGTSRTRDAVHRNEILNLEVLISAIYLAFGVL